MLRYFDNEKIENYESNSKPMSMERFKAEIEMTIKDEKVDV